MLLAQLVLQMGGAASRRDKTGEAPLVASNPAVGARARRRSRAPDGRHDHTRQVPWDRLDELVPDELDRYWQLTLEFLKIAREAWPAILAERGAIEPAARRDRLIEAEAARLAAHTDGPVIAAGSTGSMPATAELIATIARLPHGAVVLPGLDTDLDAESWDLIAGRRDAAGRELIPPAVGHPQFAMQALLRRIGITRDAVVALGEPAAHGRERLVSEALRPAAATDRWQRARRLRLRRRASTPRSQALSVIEAANAEEEALAIAVALREAVETAGKTAALVTPDRALARRVLAALERWNIAGRRFRRRCARRHAGRRVRAARGRGGARRARPGDAARAAQASADPARRGGGGACARDRGAGTRGPARPAAASQEAPALRMRSRRFATNSASFAAANDPICIASDPRVYLSDGELDRRGRAARAIRGRARAAGRPCPARRTPSPSSPHAIATSSPP